MVNEMSNYPVYSIRSSIGKLIPFLTGKLEPAIFSLLILVITASTALAETQLIASVDRSKIYEMDTFNLTVEGEIDVDFSFGGLMNFGLNQSDAPDISVLEQDFEVLDTQQSYNMQSINGEAKAKVLWRYSLAPRKTGILEIPPITYKDAQTNAIQIRVVDGKAPKNSTEPPAVFLEVETDKTEAYVQEQIIYTLRLYTQGLINGELSEPSSSDAIIEPFGEQKKYYRMAFNQRYEVVERQYLIFPQKSGLLEIANQEFQGVTLRQGRRTRIKDLSDKVQLNIKAPPESFSGKTWLPATSLFIKEEWQGDPAGVKVGDSLSRKIVTSSLGLLGSALPPVSMNAHSNIKLYTDKPQIETVQHENGAQATRIDSFAVVALKEGDIELDEIRIPWWDIVNDVERVAVIPASTVKILPNPDLSINRQLSPVEEPPVSSASDQQTAQSSGKTEADKLLELNASSQRSGQTHIWQTIAAVLLLGWIITIALLYRKIAALKAHLQAIPFPKPNEKADEKRRYEQAIKAVKALDNNLIQLVFNWLECFDDLQPSAYTTLNLQALKELDTALYQQLSAFEASQYGNGKSTDFDVQALLNALKLFRQAKLKTQTENATGSSRFLNKQALEPFYE